ncbi:hypothetical protein BC834DRAFT_975054 [Gloeopeniophorella convolvens]|nr:hypothetical protein BC834DRAFT_975054 [Gloeopeniophorella convolvens]
MPHTPAHHSAFLAQFVADSSMHKVAIRINYSAAHWIGPTFSLFADVNLVIRVGGLFNEYGVEMTRVLEGIDFSWMDQETCQGYVTLYQEIVNHVSGLQAFLDLDPSKEILQAVIQNLATQVGNTRSDHISSLRKTMLEFIETVLGKKLDLMPSTNDKSDWGLNHC